MGALQGRGRTFKLSRPFRADDPLPAGDDDLTVLCGRVKAHYPCNPATPHSAVIARSLEPRLSASDSEDAFSATRLASFRFQLSSERG